MTRYRHMHAAHVLPRCAPAVLPYAHADEELRLELEKHLGMLRRQGVITDWSDRQIDAGTSWEPAILRNLELADVILLLISPDFINSRYCYDVEMSRAIERHNSGQALVIPILLRDVDWHGAPFSQLHMLPTDVKPVVRWRSRDAAFADVARGIRQAIEHFKPLQNLYRARVQTEAALPKEPSDRLAFGRTHPYTTVLRRWLTASDAGLRALGSNLIHDGWVSVAREALFNECVAEMPEGSSGLRHALISYFNTRIRLSRAPDFTNTDLNSANIIAANDPAFSRHVEFVRLLDLSALTTVYLWARENHVPAFRTFPDRADLRKVSDWLAVWLGDDISETADAFIADVLDALNEYSKIHPFQPTWVVTRRTFEQIQRDVADTWMTAAGVYPQPGRWVIALAYSRQEVGSLVRPTVLDTGWNATFFPAPASTSLHHGTPAMNVGSVETDVLLEQFVHEQIDHSVTQWFKAGRLIGRTTVADTLPIEQARQRHHDTLIRTYGVSVLEWMPKTMIG